jgi:hypothetical protein
MLQYGPVMAITSIAGREWLCTPAQERATRSCAQLVQCFRRRFYRRSRQLPRLLFPGRLPRQGAYFRAQNEPAQELCQPRLAVAERAMSRMPAAAGADGSGLERYLTRTRGLAEQSIFDFENSPRQSLQTNCKPTRVQSPNEKTRCNSHMTGAPEEIRTPDPQIRSLSA